MRFVVAVLAALLIVVGVLVCFVGGWSIGFVSVLVGGLVLALQGR